MSDYFVHESSYIDDNVTIGKGTKIWHFCHVQSGAVIGERCSLGQNVNIGNNVRIGNGVRIQNNVSVYEGVELEDNVFCGPSCVFTNVTTPRAHFPVHGHYAHTLIREGASLGAIRRLHERVFRHIVPAKNRPNVPHERDCRICH